MVSGLKVNFHKSQVFGVGVSDMELSNCARILGCNVGAFPFKYLGVPIGANMNLKRNWAPVIEKVRSKLSSWKANSLSFGGRLTLTKSVLGSLPLYFFSLFKAPNSVIDSIEKIRRKFLWGGSEEKNKIHWVSWKVVLGPKNKGGLGIGSSLNWALMIKWLYRFKGEKHALCRKVVCGIHNADRKPLHSLSKKSICGTWQSITKTVEALEKIGTNLHYFLSFDVKVGKDTLFWQDRWSGGADFATQFPRLYNLDRKKSCCIAERLEPMHGRWAWLRKPRCREEMEELEKLQDHLPNFQASELDDVVRSRLDTDGRFFVKDARNLIDSFITCEMPNAMIWIHIVPLKVNCFIWRACIKRIPTAHALDRRGIQVADLSCLGCSNGRDETDHLLATCDLAKDVLTKIWQWCNITSPSFDAFTEIISFAANWGNCSKKRSILLAIVYGFA